MREESYEIVILESGKLNEQGKCSQIGKPGGYLYESITSARNQTKVQKEGVIERRLNFQTLGQEYRNNWKQAQKSHVPSLSLYSSL